MKKLLFLLVLVGLAVALVNRRSARTQEALMSDAAYYPPPLSEVLVQEYTGETTQFNDDVLGVAFNYPASYRAFHMPAEAAHPNALLFLSFEPKPVEAGYIASVLDCHLAKREDGLGQCKEVGVAEVDILIESSDQIFNLTQVPPEFTDCEKVVDEDLGRLIFACLDAENGSDSATTYHVLLGAPNGQTLHVQARSDDLESHLEVIAVVLQSAGLL